MYYFSLAKVCLTIVCINIKILLTFSLLYCEKSTFKPKMKLNKIKLSSLNDAKRLSDEQMKAAIGGYDTSSDAHCIYNCMEYIGKEVYAKDPNYKDQGFDQMTEGHYCAGFVFGHGSYSGSYSRNGLDDANGPSLYDDNGNFNSDIVNCINSYFDKAASQFTIGSEVAKMFAAGSNDGVMGIFKTGEGVAHAVIITGYDSKTDTYSYYDPSKSSQDSNQTFKASDLYGAIDCKQ